MRANREREREGRGGALTGLDVEMGDISLMIQYCLSQLTEKILRLLH